MGMIHSLTNIKKVILIILNATKDKKLIIHGLGMQLITRASDPRMNKDLFIVFELESLVDALVVAFVFDSEHDVDILRFVAQAEELVADLVANGPFLRPEKVEFIFDKAVTVVDKDQIPFDHGHVLLLSVRLRTVVKVFLKQQVY